MNRVAFLGDGFNLYHSVLRLMRDTGLCTKWLDLNSLMQNKVTSKKRNILDKLASLNQRVYETMLLKEQFVSIYTAGDRKTAQRNLKDWIVAAIKSKIPSLVELGYKFFRKRHYILNYFICRITTAVSEGINNKIKRLSRMAYGFKDVKYFLLKIHQHCGLLNPRLST